MADIAPQMPPGSSDPRTPRQQVLARLKALEKEAEGWRPAWRDLASHCLPGSSREPGDNSRAADQEIEDKPPDSDGALIEEGGEALGVG